MKTLAAIQKQIAQLQKQAEAIASTAKKEAIGKARELIERHGLTAEDLGLAGGKRKAATKVGKSKASSGAGTPKYRDPATGKTWTGVGRAPAWIAEAKDRSKFLVEGTSDAKSAEPGATVRTRARKSATEAPSRAKTQAGAKSTGGVKAAKPASKRVAARRAGAGKKATADQSAVNAAASAPAAGPTDNPPNLSQTAVQASL